MDGMIELFFKNVRSLIKVSITGDSRRNSGCVQLKTVMNVHNLE